MSNRSLIGKGARSDGILVERLTRRFYESCGCIVHRINDGAIITKDGFAIRRKQFCDFIIFPPDDLPIKGIHTKGRPLFVDAKKLPRGNITPSRFTRVGSSTNNQYTNFMRVNTHYRRIICYFHFVNIETNEHFKLNPVIDVQAMHSKNLVKL